MRESGTKAVDKAAVTKRAKLLEVNLLFEPLLMARKLEEAAAEVVLVLVLMLVLVLASEAKSVVSTRTAGRRGRKHVSRCGRRQRQQP